MRKLALFSIFVLIGTISVHCKNHENGQATTGNKAAETTETSNQLVDQIAVTDSGTSASGMEPEIAGKELPPRALQVLREVLIQTEISSALVTSTSRSPEDQARIMYEYARQHGAQAAYALYGPEGDEIVKVYEQHRDKDRQFIIAEMFAETTKQLPIAHANKRLMHTNPTHEVFDIAISSIPESKRQAFIKAVKAHPRVHRFLGPEEGEKDAFHIEIPKEDQ